MRLVVVVVFVRVVVVGHDRLHHFTQFGSGIKSNQRALVFIIIVRFGIDRHHDTSTGRHGCGCIGVSGAEIIQENDALNDGGHGCRNGDSNDPFLGRSMLPYPS